MIHKNENVWAPQKRIFTSKARLNSEVYGQAAKITPEVEKKRLLFPRTFSFSSEVPPKKCFDSVTLLTKYKS